MDATWTTNTVGIHEALDFLEQWWAVFLVAPFVAGPLLYVMALPGLRRKSQGTQHRKKKRSPSKSRRSLPRRLFVDDSVHRGDGLVEGIPKAQLFTSTFIVASAVSALLFFLIATVLIVRAVLLVNEGHNM